MNTEFLLLFFFLEINKTDQIFLPLFLVEKFSPTNLRNLRNSCDNI